MSRAMRSRAHAILTVVLMLAVVSSLASCAATTEIAPASPSAPVLTRPPIPTGPTYTVRAFVTGYSYFDNTRPHSTRISHPVLHSAAGGRGTYQDPITVAVGHTRQGGRNALDWPAGTRFYVPNLRRYLIVEDTCGDGDRPQDGPCHVGYPSEASTWLNVWVGGAGGGTGEATVCMQAITGVWEVVVNPPPGLAADPGDLYSPARTWGEPVGCVTQYGDGLVRIR